MLKTILDAAKLDPAFCADLIGVSATQFRQWVSGQRPIPAYMVSELSSVLGVPEDLLDGSDRTATSPEMVTPAIWFKLRNENLTSADRELLALVRKLGVFMDQLSRSESSSENADQGLLRSIFAKVEKSAPPAVQGREAARLWRRETGLDHELKGIGELIRPNLRRQGAVVVESSLPQSPVEGCSFKIGARLAPCLFANSYASTWFRRNSILLHEFAHVIFDLESDQVAIDYKDVRKSSLEEIRAEAFAQEALVPQEVLVQVSSRYGLNWKSLSEAGLAKIAAATHAEPKLILKAAKECGWIDEDQWLAYTMYSCESELKEASEHALSTEEYLHTLAELPPWIASNRQARVGKISVVLPVNYVKRVLEAWEARRIADGKAAEMLFIDKAEFKRRFADTLPDIRSAF